MTRPAQSAVTATAPAAPAVALQHFATRLSVETDADDVAEAIREGLVDFSLIDVRSPEAYAAGHLPGAINLPHRRIDQTSAAELPDGTVVVYCWGPGCNGAAKGAAALAQHGRAVKEMLGGFEYFARAGHPVEGDAVASGQYLRDESGLVTLPSSLSCDC